MLTPAIVDIISFSYPIGNTPAVCLTQDLPCEETARILLLGCGDVRNMLFTSYCENISEPRQIDITCCDLEAAVLARNIILLTLLVDDTQDSNDRYLWNIYYHLYLDEKSLRLVQAQGEKLYTLSSSTESWHNSIYGRTLRFCDSKTLASVREIWCSYITMSLGAGERADYDERFRATILKAKDAKARHVARSMVLTGFRSAAPVGILSMMDIPHLYEHYWDHGVTDHDHESMSEARNPNPMFASLRTNTSTLHYGTDPLLGFHLATAYVPMTSKSPLHLKTSKNSLLPKVVEAARLQFRTWGHSFKRRARQNLTLRFFAGEALAFCHTLQHKGHVGKASSANWYRGPRSLDELTLDGEDYAANGDAPLLFNLIDTSNLMDHLGAINILVSTSPLLECDKSATLYTESLVRREESHKALIDGLLCGNFATVSILLGLFPIEYWTNATATSSVDETLLDAAERSMGKLENNKGQMRCRLTWKRPISAISDTSKSTAWPNVHFNEADLAHILFQVYLKMFHHEDMSSLFSKVDLLTIQNNSLPRYHRGSLASLICFVKKRVVVVDWNNMMKIFLGLVEDASNIAMGKNYIQELYLQLHLLGVHTVETLRGSLNGISDFQGFKELCAWDRIPEVVCITLKVPRAKLQVFTKIPLEEIGTPPLHCMLQASPNYSGRPWQNLYAVVQLTFGEATTTGSRHDENCRFTVAEDKLGWTGSSPMFVSFCTPSWMLCLESKATTVAFGLQSTPHSSMRFVKHLGLSMNVYKTNLGDKDNVYISKYRPNQSGHTSICNFRSSDDLTAGSCNEAVSTTIAANCDPKTGTITAMTGRVTLLSEEAKSGLKNGASVETTQTSPCIIGVSIGKKSPQHLLYFPAPVLRSHSKARIARKSGYIEVVAPICGPLDKERFSHFMYPLFVHGRNPVIWNMPHLNLDCLPILDVAKTEELQWLITHCSLMLSARERASREKSMRFPAEIQKDVRVNFKDSLFSMFMHFTGIQGGRASFFGISNPAGGGIHILVFMSCLRLDMANHTVVLDAAVLPLTDWLTPRIHKFLRSLTDVGICQIKVDDDEMQLWKEVIPAMVERCRQWSHRSSCEYVTKNKIPLSVESGQALLCSCGEGTLPANFISGIPHWDMASNHAVRAAISPTFSLPFVELSHDVESRTALTDVNSNTVPRNASSATIPTDANSDQCRVCGTGKSSPSTKLSKCARCYNVKYCSAACQRVDWKEHKKVCKK